MNQTSLWVKVNHLKMIYSFSHTQAHTVIIWKVRKGSPRGKATHCHQKGEVSVKTEAIGALNTSKTVAKIPGVSSEPLPSLVPVAWRHFLFQSLLHRISCVSGISKPHVRTPSNLNSIHRGTLFLWVFFLLCLETNGQSMMTGLPELKWPLQTAFFI